MSGTADAVTNHADEMALMNRIAPSKRVRGNVEKWASSTVSLRGGRIENSEGHPDAHKVWTFGSYKQRLTDAVNYYGDGADHHPPDERRRSRHVHGRGGRATTNSG